MKIVLVGDYGVGKTSIINSYCNVKDVKKASVGPDIKSKDVIESDGTQIKISLWDTAG